MLKEYRDIEKFDNGDCIKYMRVSMPLMTDRDNVMSLSTREMEGGWFLNMKTVEHPAMPPQKKIIRMFNHVNAFFKQEGDNVTMVDFEYANMKGYLPASLMNMAIASETAKEYKNMMNNLYARQK